MKKLITALFIPVLALALIAAGILGTETRLLFYWPACALLGLAALLAVLRGKWPMRSSPSDLCFATALLFGFYFIGRCFTSPVTAWAREDLFLLLGCAVVYILSATALSHRHLRMTIFILLLLLTLGNLAVGFIHFSGKWTFHVVPGYMRSFGDVHRIGGFYNNPNHLAAFLSVMTLFTASVALFGRGGATWKLLLVFISLASAVGVALTVSRGALVGLGTGALTLVVLGLWVLAKTYPTLIGKVILGIGALAMLMGLGLSSVFSEQLQSRSGIGSIQQGDPRLYIWRAALAQYAEHPALGSGARMFYAGCIKYRTADSVSWMQDALFAHNEWLQALADYGVVGLALVALMMLIHLLNGLRFLRWFVGERFPRKATIASNNLGFTIGSITAIVAMLVHAVFEFHFHVPATALTAAFMLGILTNPGIEDPIHRPTRIIGVRPLMKLTLILAGAVLLYGTWAVGRADYYFEQGMLHKFEEDGGHSRIALLDKAISIDTNDAKKWLQRGRAHKESADDLADNEAKPLLLLAVNDLEIAHQLNPADYLISLALADAYDAVNRSDDAEHCIKEALIAAPLFMEPRIVLAIHLHRQGRFVEAEEAYLWASQAKAGLSNEWFSLYKAMLHDASH